MSVQDPSTQEMLRASLLETPQSIGVSSKIWAGETTTAARARSLRNFPRFTMEWNGVMRLKRASERGATTCYVFDDGPSGGGKRL